MREKREIETEKREREREIDRERERRERRERNNKTAAGTARARGLRPPAGRRAAAAKVIFPPRRDRALCVQSGKGTIRGEDGADAREPGGRLHQGAEGAGLGMGGDREAVLPSRRGTPRRGLHPAGLLSRGRQKAA